MPLPSPPHPAPPINPFKGRTGFDRVVFAVGHSFAGLRSAWGEPAFRQEAIAAIVMLPGAFLLGRGWVETALLVATVLIVMIVELLNTAVEAAVDRIGPEWHNLSKRAKDVGSAAVMLSLLLCGGVWATAIFQCFFT